MKKTTKKSLGLNKRTQCNSWAPSVNNNQKEESHQKFSSPCRKIFVRLPEDSKWSPEMVKQSRFEDRVYLETKNAVDRNQSRETLYESIDNLKKVGKYYNTSLPLIPDIRSLSIQEKSHDNFLNLFGIRTRLGEIGGNQIILKGGPNGRANRYLKYQYSRLLPLIGAYKCLNKKETEISEYKWFYNALEGRLMGRPYTDIFYDQLKNEKLSKIHIYPPSKHTLKWNQKPIELIKAEQVITNIKDAKEWINSEEGYKFICENNLTELKYVRRIVIRFPVKYYYPKGNTMKTFSRKKYKKNIAKFWMLRALLLTKSNIFAIAITNMLWKDERAFSERNIWDLMNWISGYQKLIAQWKQDPSIKRLWIKTNEKWRPLGVAPRKWRLVMKAEQIFLDIFVRGSWDETQHGYITSKGVNTAWREIFEKKIITNYKNIFEYDFRGFFNNINLKHLGEILFELDMPKHEIGRFLNLVGCDIEPADYSELELVSRETLEKYEYINLFRKNFRWKGVPQGSGISPILSVLSLNSINHKLKKHKIQCLKYADDGIFYSNSCENPLEILKRNSEITGVEFNYNKSDWVKKNGKWIKPLKFLGLTYDPYEDILKASTRGNRDKGRPSSDLKLELLNFIRVKSYPGEKMSEVLTIDDILEKGETKVLSRNGEIINDDKVFGGVANSWDFLGINDRTLEDFWKNNLRFFKENNLVKNYESYYRQTDLRYEKVKISIKKKDLKEIKEFITKKPIKWYNKQVESYWLKEKIMKFPTNFLKKNKIENGLLKQLQSQLQNHIKPYFILECENNEWFALFEREPIVERVLIKNERIPKKNIEFIENIKWSSKKSRDFEYGKWYKIPKEEIKSISVGPFEEIYVSVINYKNVWDKWCFNGLIARLFAGSFDLSTIVQDFKKTIQPESLLGMFNKILGKNRIDNIVNKNKICFSNETTISCFLLNKVLENENLAQLLGLKTHSKGMEVNKHWKVVYKRIIERLINKRCGTILQTKIKIDQIVREKMNLLKKVTKKAKMSVESFQSIHKTPIIIFNGPFDPSSGLHKKAKNLRLNTEVTRILGHKYLNATTIGLVAHMNKENRYLRKRKIQYSQEINKKVRNSVWKEGMNKQVMLNQFFGHHDMWKLPSSQMELFNESKMGSLDIYGWAHDYYKVRETDIGFIKKPKKARWYDWGPKISKKIYKKSKKR